jgi:Methyltransferase domain
MRTEIEETAGANDSNRYYRLGGRTDVLTGSEPASSNPIRLQRQFDIIFSGNRNVFRGARVLDLMSSSGFWSLAALDAGARHVVGVERSVGLVESAKKAFSEHRVDVESYQFVNGDDPGTFELVLCHGYLERSDPRQLFAQLNRLQINRVLLDTRISVGKGPIVRLKQRSGEEIAQKFKGRSNSILSIPNHELVTFFCDYFGFSWRLILAKSSELSDWTGLDDYEQDRRRTYLLERSVTASGAA